MGIELRNIEKHFGNFHALQDVSLKVETGELLALLGPSGCGKTTLLRIIAGLEAPDTGQILMDGSDTTLSSPKDKQVGFVFQHYALFPNMNVFENVAFGLRVLRGAAKVTREEINARVKELLGLVQMDWAQKRFPSQLSGGQRQRVALARALAVRPKVLLLDEPFSALDAKVRLELRRWLRTLHDEIHVTSVFVTHDQEEALELADRIVIINQGKVEQIGTPNEVYENPANAFVYNFLGNVNVFHSRIEEGQASIGQLAVEVPSDLHHLQGSMAQGFVRPHEIGISTTRSSPGELEAEIRAVRVYGGRIGLELKRADGGGLLEAEVPREQYRTLGIDKGSVVYVTLHNIRFFRKQAGDEDYQI